MRRFFIAGSALFAFAAVPALAASPQRMADKDFTRLSKDGQKAFADIVQAQQALGSNQNGQAQSLINDAQAHLTKAATDNRAFMKRRMPCSPHRAMLRPSAP
ncbi:YfdX family protein [Asaia platycodi]|uniref:YfdX family protein n=1 Tax=Asaia platycodi TaxID=610243 RepID=UPI00068897FB|nr:YfdX family protein [Asaia platycodi]